MNDRSSDGLHDYHFVLVSLAFETLAKALSTADDGVTVEVHREVEAREWKQEANTRVAGEMAEGVDLVDPISPAMLSMKVVLGCSP